VDEWFLGMDDLRPLLMDITKQINWIPSFGMDRELDWLKNMQDWMISKKRYWGLALPIWECDKCDHWTVIGDDIELKERAVSGYDQFEGHTPHRPWIDAVKIGCEKCSSEMTRVPDVGNPWLDAGIVTFSTLSYRQDPDYWKEWYPADWISESFPGQFRNWFYSMLVMGAIVDNSPSFNSISSPITVQWSHLSHSQMGRASPQYRFFEIIQSCIFFSQSNSRSIPKLGIQFICFVISISSGLKSSMPKNHSSTNRKTSSVLQRQHVG
jgi:isoleucyl-tRNA synthetase